MPNMLNSSVKILKNLANSPSIYLKWKNHSIKFGSRNYGSSKGNDPSIKNLKFDYRGENGPENWKKKFPDCDGKNQSPIDIITKDLKTTKLDKNLCWVNYGLPPKCMNLENNGHTLTLSGAWDKGKEPIIEGGPLKGQYIFHQIHFHWGSDNECGSEHTLDGKPLPLEMHAVHWKKECGSFDKAVKDPDGLAVVGCLYKIDEKANIVMEFILQTLAEVAGDCPKKIKIPKAFPLDMLDMTFEKGYATYKGSLTTPPCCENVTWLIKLNPCAISCEQLDVFRSGIVIDGQPINNYRPVQPLNDRVVCCVEE